MKAYSLVLSFLLAVAPSLCEHHKTFHSKISSSSSRFLFHHNSRDRGHDHHHQSFKKQLESTTLVPNESEDEVTTISPPISTDQQTASLNYSSYQKSLPLRILSCMTKVSILQCSKLYLLQNMESRDYIFDTSGNLTQDVKQILLPSYRRPDDKLFEDHLFSLNSSEVDRRINHGLVLLFNNRHVDFKFLPGFGVQLSPSEGNKLEFSIKKQVASDNNDMSSTDIEGRKSKDRDRDEKKDKSHRGTKKIYRHLIRLGVPAVLLPSVLLASVLPMMMPVIKFATFWTSVVNHAALAAAVMYLAKQHAQEQEEKQTVYFNAGYN
ncbi:uncharacterized protein LOC129739686 [Uranotaenia lowii]|uniref:uncharacterized protein LOC129739686 n=1 Tax=Uranotaenia lowii TaxID=190385 RepID=UPI00247992C0|nr:uncharacterized protein LOC129739686 [Uranotaenia lowii]